MEYYGFIHFGINTVNDAEWGDGKENISLFHPKQVDTDQWVKVLQEAQMSGVILTCKHHDGFCLWPTQTTTFSVKSTPWCNGKGDLVRDLSNSCKKYGLKFGIYLSPWDQNASVYGSGGPYDDFYIQQLTELLTDYGDIFCVWLDGANGEGPNGKTQFYNWNRYYETIRTLQPNAVISVCGPDVRWCGNEAGQTRSQEWSVVPERMRDLEKIIEKSQHKDDGAFSRKLNSGDEDLGSRQVLENYEDALIWYPAEVNTSIRPGWFFHERENEVVRSVSELYDIYLRSVGGNATFLLNCPPDKEGQIYEKDAAVLYELGKKIQKLKNTALLKKAVFSCSSQEVQLKLSELKRIDGKFWQSNATDEKPWIQLSWQKEQEISTLILQENILKSQRVENFDVYSLQDDDEWQLETTGKTIGYKKIILLSPIRTKAIRIVFKTYRQYPTIAAINVVNEQNGV